MGSQSGDLSQLTEDQIEEIKGIFGPAEGYTPYLSAQEQDEPFELANEGRDPDDGMGEADEA